ncbi:hypothetical protein [Streptomyces sp. NPDC052225]
MAEQTEQTPPPSQPPAPDPDPANDPRFVTIYDPARGGHYPPGH